MLLEQRTYTLTPGRVRDYLAIYERDGLAVQCNILGDWRGCFVTEIGPLNQVMHLWAFADFNQRLERRARLMADPLWKAYLAQVAGLVLQQENRILLPASFMPASSMPASPMPAA